MEHLALELYIYLIKRPEALIQRIVTIIRLFFRRYLIGTLRMQIEWNFKQCSRYTPLVFRRINASVRPQMETTANLPFINFSVYRSVNSGHWNNACIRYTNKYHVLLNEYVAFFFKDFSLLYGCFSRKILIFGNVTIIERLTVVNPNTLNTAIKRL